MTYTMYVTQIANGLRTTVDRLEFFYKDLVVACWECDVPVSSWLNGKVVLRK